MKSALPFIATVLFAAMPAIAETPKPDVVAFNASVRVEVDAAGKPLKVEAPANLPASIRGYIEKRVASWHYQPARRDGVPASAVTFVRVGACALPVAEGYRLGLDFKGNGPAIDHAGSWFMPPPSYPIDLVRVGAEGTFIVSYAIQASGATRVTSIRLVDGTGSKRYEKSFRSALTRWIEGLHYRPEQVGGAAVATDMEFPVVFSLGFPKSNKTYREERETEALASRECQAASMPGGPLPIATNSPVKVTPVPAG